MGNWGSDIARAWPYGESLNLFVQDGGGEGRGSEKIAALKTITDGRSAGSRMLDGGELRSTKHWALAAKPAQTFQQRAELLDEVESWRQTDHHWDQKSGYPDTQTHLFEPY